MRRHVSLILAPTMVYLAAVDVQSQVAEQGAPQIGAAPQAAANPTIDARPALVKTNPRLTTPVRTLGRQTPQSEGDPLEGHLDNCPISSCCAGIMSQSFSMEIVPGTGIACTAGGNTTPNAWARCFSPIDEGWADEGGVVTMTIESIDFGFETEPPVDTGPIPIFVNVYIDTDGCPPNMGNAVLIGTVETAVSPGDAGVLLTAVFDPPLDIELPVGAGLIVEYENQQDGTEVPFFGLWPGMNPEGQCGASYIRTATCGVPDWLNPEDLCFCNYRLALRVHVSGDCSAEGLNCQADANADGHIGPFDLATLLAAWGPCGAGDPCECLDANGDGVIGPLDLAMLLGSWGPCP